MMKHRFMSNLAIWFDVQLQLQAASEGREAKVYGASAAPVKGRKIRCSDGIWGCGAGPKFRFVFDFWYPFSYKHIFKGWWLSISMFAYPIAEFSRPTFVCQIVGWYVYIYIYTHCLKLFGFLRWGKLFDQTVSGEILAQENPQFFSSVKFQFTMVEFHVLS